MPESTLTNRLQVAGVTLDPESISLDLDEDRVPYAILRATVPLDDATIDQLDPRTSPPPRVNVGMTQAFGYGETIAAISADYAGMTLADMGRYPTVLNANPGFEDGINGWTTTGVASNTTLTSDATHVHGGADAALMVINNPGTVGVFGRFGGVERFPVQGGVAFHVEGWFYSTSANAQPRVGVFWYDADGNLINTHVPGGSNATANQWVYRSSVTAAPPNAVEAQVLVHCSFFSTHDRIWVDDVRMHQARLTLASFTAEYGAPFNPGGWRPSTRVRAKLYLADRQVDHATGTVQITANSDDGRLNEYALTSRTAVTPSGSTVRDCVNMVLGHVLGAALPAGSTGAEVVETDALAWQPGEVAWSYLSGIIGMAGLRLWCDERGAWHLEDPELVEVPGQYVASPDVLVDLTDAVSRESGGWADGAVVTYEWDDATTGDRRVAYDAAGVQGGRSIDRTVQRPYPGAGLARGMLRKAQARGRVLGLGGVADYSVRPYQAAQANLPDDSVHAGTVAAVVWSQPDDRMAVRTRDLLGITEHSWLFDPPGMSWDSIPPGTDWTED